MTRLPEFLSISALVVLGAMLLTAVGQPVITDDAWWHLAHGRAYAEQGPWLEADPLLFTAPAPPAPASWLADLLMYATHALGGFSALRLTHVLLVLGIVGLLFKMLADASRSRVSAGLLTATFICLSTYRLVQLRPHLFSILAALLLFQLLFASSKSPSRRHLFACVALLAVWANVHAAFVLGPVIIATGLIGLLLDEACKPRNDRDFGSRKIRAVAAVLILGSAATCINPEGIEPHFAYLIAGDETPSLARVGDEWASFNLFTPPAPRSIPTPVSWGLVWVLLIGAGGVLFRTAIRSTQAGVTALRELDFVTLNLAFVSFVAMMLAVRFTWLAVFPLLFLARALRAGDPPLLPRGPALSFAAAFATALLVAAFFSAGAWPLVSRGIPRSAQSYARDYPPEKYHAHSVWLLKDSGLQGNLFSEYYMGGFVGYWLSPDVKTFVNGSLNVTTDVIDSNLPIREHRGAIEGEDFLELLDRQHIDIFLGIRLPRTSAGARPWFHTTAYLENVPGWVPVFRNLTSAVYLRDNAKNKKNFERISDYYRRQGVPFDSERGFEPALVIDDEQMWATDHALVPRYFQTLIERANDRSSRDRFNYLNMQSEIYAALGAYAQAIAIDRQLLASEPNAIKAHRRLIWSLLRSNRIADAKVAAKAFARLTPADGLSRNIIATAYGAMTPDNADAAQRRALARLPVFTHAEAQRLGAGMAWPEIR